MSVWCVDRRCWIGKAWSVDTHSAVVYLSEIEGLAQCIALNATMLDNLIYTTNKRLNDYKSDYDEIYGCIHEGVNRLAYFRRMLNQWANTCISIDTQDQLDRYRNIYAKWMDVCSISLERSNKLTVRRWYTIRELKLNTNLDARNDNTVLVNNPKRVIEDWMKRSKSSQTLTDELKEFHCFCTKCNCSN